jgi:hypothetical protein
MNVIVSVLFSKKFPIELGMGSGNSDAFEVARNAGACILNFRCPGFARENIFPLGMTKAEQIPQPIISR